MTYILGLNAYHADAAACLVKDGELVAAVEEERFRRIKHWAGFPVQSIAYCLREAGLSLADIDHVAVNQDGRAQRWRKLGYVLANRPQPSLLFQRLRNRRKREAGPELLAAAFPGERFGGEFHHIEHHLAPYGVHVVFERRPGDVRQRLFVRAE